MIKGISLYTGLEDYPLQAIKQFLDKHKFDYIDFIFTSFHISEAKDYNLNFLIDELKDTKIKLVIDFSKKTYDLFEFNKTIIPRLDYGFSVNDIMQMVNDHEMIELNASIVNIDLLVQLKERQVDFNKLRVSFNFYPNEYTGMSYQDVKNKIKLFHEFSLKVIIYIPALNKRPPMYQGLPTIEEQRHQTVLENLIEATYLGCDGVCVGDAIITDEELKTLLEYEPFDISNITLDVELNDNLTSEELSILKAQHILRVDESPYLIRSSMMRQKYDVLPNNTEAIVQKGSIVINNNTLKRYVGELSIIKEDLKNNGGLNVVGKINIKPELLKGGSKVTFRF